MATTHTGLAETLANNGADIVPVCQQQGCLKPMQFPDGLFWDAFRCRLKEVMERETWAIPCSLDIRTSFGILAVRSQNGCRSPMPTMSSQRQRVSLAKCKVIPSGTEHGAAFGAAPRTRLLHPLNRARKGRIIFAPSRPLKTGASKGVSIGRGCSMRQDFSAGRRKGPKSAAWDSFQEGKPDQLLFWATYLRAFL